MLDCALGISPVASLSGVKTHGDKPSELQTFRHTIENAVQGEAVSRTRDVVEARMFDMMATPGISCRLIFQYAPVTARRMCVGLSLIHI